jgi:hypothetical protein
MKFDSQSAFPYPVLRSDNDDYVGEDFTVKSEVSATNDMVLISVTFNLTCSEILELINNGCATYGVLVTSRETFEQRFFESNINFSEFKINSQELRGRVSIEPYVVAKKEINNFKSISINNEFGFGPFSFEPGEVLAQATPSDFSISRDYFKPLQSIVKINLKDDLPKGEWSIKLEGDYIVVDVSKNIHNIYNKSKNSINGKNIMLNSIWFSVFVHAVEMLKSSDGLYGGYIWADVVSGKINNLGIDKDSQDSYKIVTALLNHPLQRMDSVF